jgi:hypothetical protein
MTSSGRTPVSSGPINGLDALEGAKPHDRSRSDDSTDCGRASRRSCPADGRGDRPHVPQRLRATVAMRVRGGELLPRPSRPTGGILGPDEPDQPALCGGAGPLYRAASASRRVISQRPAQRRCNGRAPTRVPAQRGGRFCRQGPREGSGLPHREAAQPADRPALSVDRQVDGDGEPLLHLCGRR